MRPNPTLTMRSYDMEDGRRGCHTVSQLTGEQTEDRAPWAMTSAIVKARRQSALQFPPKGAVLEGGEKRVELG